MPVEHQQGRVHHRDLGFDQFNQNIGGDNNNNDHHHHNHERDDNNNNKISYSAIVNKSIIMNNKLAWGKTSSLMSKTTQQNNSTNMMNNLEQDKPMYRSSVLHHSSTTQHRLNNRFAPSQQQNFYTKQHSRSSSASTSATISSSSRTPTSGNTNQKNSYKLMTPSLIALILASSLAVVVISITTTTQAYLVEAEPQAPSVANNKQDEPLQAASSSIGGGGGDTNNRRDSSDSASGGEKSSVVASLSSAVASAAAAAAVAAAKNSLSAGDARSLLGSAAAASSSRHQQQRSPGLNFALKLADSIPEVPYSILHNMGKLDHAAPFYNYPGKLSSSNSGTRGKESAQSFLVSALTSPGGAADQLTALFRSPLWKRIADGYGEFSSEFRSLFRARPTTMKGPSSSTSKLLRDISMPAALLLLASAIPSDWRPTIKNRRKSSPLEPPVLPDLSKLAAGLAPVDEHQSSMMDTSASELMRNFSPMPQEQQQFSFKQQTPIASLANYPMNSRPLVGQYAIPGIGPALQQANGDNANMAPAQYLSGSESVGGNTGNWMSPPTGKSASLQASVGQQQQQQQQSVSSLDGRTQLPIKRVGEQAAYYSETNGGGAKYQQTNLNEPVDHNIEASFFNSPQVAAVATAEARDSGNGLFSSLTSNLAKINHPARLLMNKIMNANSAASSSGIHHYQTMMASPSSNDDGHERMSGAGSGLFSSLISRQRDHQLLSDKHRYSLVGEEAHEGTKPSSYPSSASARPSFLSAALGKAAMRILSPNESGSAGSSRAKHLAGVDSVKRNSPNSLLGSGDRTTIINLKEPSVILRRESAIGSHTLVGQQEQRDLTQLLPQSWREVVKRTVNSVKQEASTQWRSIEGQLSNWVQDKLKTLPMTPSQPGAGAAPAATSTSSISLAAATPTAGQPAAGVSNLIASVSSTAMSLLGLGGRSSAAPGGAKGSSDSAGSSAEAAQSSTATTAKNDSSKQSTTANNQPSLKSSALAGVANMIVNTLANRQAAPSTASQKPANADESSSSSQSNIVSQYPTLTGAQPSQSSQQSATSVTSTAR